MTCKILLPVDGSEGSLRAAHHVANIAAQLKDLEVHLVSVQPRGDDWMVRRMIKPEELADLEQAWAEDVLAPAGKILQVASINLVAHVVQGEAAPAIVQLAKELNCDQIVMGTRGLSPLGDLLMGSVATRVLHLAAVPVTFVK